MVFRPGSMIQAKIGFAQPILEDCSRPYHNTMVNPWYCLIIM